jgi:hypothetical protein
MYLLPLTISNLDRLAYGSDRQDREIGVSETWVRFPGYMAHIHPGPPDGVPLATARKLTETPSSNPTSLPLLLSRDNLYQRVDPA